MTGPIPPWAYRLPWELIRKAADGYKLQPELIAAIIQSESGGNPNAIRFEPHYKYLFEINEISMKVGCTPPTMEILQKTSWGLMQVMGATAYGLGLSKEPEVNLRWASSLLIPEMGIEYGCRLLYALFSRYRSKEDVVSAYNAGSPRRGSDLRYVNQKYVDRVMGYYAELLSR